MAPMKILISGAGVAGNTLAFWLSKLGHSVTVVERFPSLRTGGLQIDLRGPGVEVMKRMGLEEAFRSKSVPEQGIQLVDSSGKRRAFFPVGKGHKFLTTDYEIMRGDLCRLLQEASQDRVNFIFQTSIESFEEKDGAVDVRLSNGTTDRYQLLVGADGLGSKTRKMMLGPDTPDAFRRFRDLYTGYFTIPRPIKEGEEYLATMYIATGRRGMMTRRHSPDEIQVYLGGKLESKRLESSRPGDVKEEQEALAEVLQGAGWQTDEILKSMKDSDNFYLERMGFVKMDSWSRGCVTLVGDAGYGPSALTGLGTTSALVGAYVLAGEIGRHCGRSDEETANGRNNAKECLAAALQAYDQTFRPFMDHVQKGLSENSGSSKLIPSSQFGVTVLTYLAGLASSLRLHILVRGLFKEEEIPWELPDYEELLRD